MNSVSFSSITRYRCREGFGKIVCQSPVFAVIIKFNGFLQIAVFQWGTMYCTMRQYLARMSLTCCKSIRLCVQFRCLTGRVKLYPFNCEITDFVIEGTVPYITSFIINATKVDRLSETALPLLLNSAFSAEFRSCHFTRLWAQVHGHISGTYPVSQIGTYSH